MSAERPRPRLTFDYQKFDAQCADIIAEGNKKAPLIQFIQRVSQGMRSAPRWPLPVSEVSRLPVWQEVGLSPKEIASLIEALTVTHGTVTTGIGRGGNPVLSEIRTLAVASLVGSLPTFFPTYENVALGDLVTAARVFTDQLPIPDQIHTPDESKKQQYEKIPNPFAKK